MKVKIHIDMQYLGGGKEINASENPTQNSARLDA